MSLAALRATLARGPAVLEHANAALDVAAAGRFVDALVGCGGRRLFTGVGKSGLMAARMASSLTSIGLPTSYVHGGEWGHGDMGGLAAGDVVAAVSHSGTTAELLALSAQLEAQHRDVQLLALTGDDSSPLARAASLSLACAAPPDSELLGLLPSGSLLAQQHIFNALLSEAAARIDLSPEQIQRHHPGGSVGARAGQRGS